MVQCQSQEPLPLDEIANLDGGQLSNMTSLARINQDNSQQPESTTFEQPMNNIETSSFQKSLPIPLSAIIVICSGIAICALALFLIHKQKKQRLANKTRLLAKKDKCKDDVGNEMNKALQQPMDIENYDAMTPNEKKYLIKVKSHINKRTYPANINQPKTDILERNQQQQLKPPPKAFIKSFDGSMVPVTPNPTRPLKKLRKKPIKNMKRSPTLTILPLVKEEPE